MSKVEPLDPELAALFAREAIPQPGADVATRVLRRVETSTAMLDFVDAGVAAKPAAAWQARHALGLGLTFVIGAGVGAATALAIRPEPPPRVQYVERPTASAVVPAASDPPAPPVVSIASLESRPPVTGTTASAPKRSDADTLAAERALIENAREKLARGEAKSALARLDEHSRRFPNARLSEEREALAIQTLVNAGLHDDARKRAAAFRTKWPTSVYLPAVDVTIQSIP